MTPLCYASLLGHVDMVCLLLSHGVHVSGLANSSPWAQASTIKISAMHNDSSMPCTYYFQFPNFDQHHARPCS